MTADYLVKIGEEVAAELKKHGRLGYVLEGDQPEAKVWLKISNFERKDKAGTNTAAAVRNQMSAIAASAGIQPPHKV